MSYKDVAMLTRLRIEMPQMTKTDKKATEDAETANHAHGAGAYRKHLYPKHLVDPMVQIGSEARGYMYSQTRPQGRSGLYFLPNVRIMTYLDAMGKYELAFWQSVTAFLNNWGNVMAQAQQQQGLLFDPTVYPDLSVLKAQFVFEYPITPVPDSVAADAVLRELDEGVAAAVMAKIRADESAMGDEVLRGAVDDLRTQVLRIAKQTTITTVENKAGERVEKSGKIYDTLTQDIAGLTALLADLKFGGSAELEEIADQIDMHLTLPADALRNNLDVCQITNAKAKDILAQLDDLL